MSCTRRRFLTYAGWGAYAALRNPMGAAAKAPETTHHGKPPSFFEPIEHSNADELVLPRGYRYDIVARWGDPLYTKHPAHGAETFGFNNDFLAYFPIDALEGGRNSREGLLFVNHEYPSGLFVAEHDFQGPKTKAQITKEKLSVGASVIHVRQREGRWEHVPGHPLTRRLTALYPEIVSTGPAAAVLPRTLGTLANCGGGRTPWMTALSCEENYQDYNVFDAKIRQGHAWHDAPGEAIDERQYGWVLEVDPFGQMEPLKHTALGRFAHENTAWRVAASGRFVVYMGDDANDQYFYKYVSAGKFRERRTGEEMLAWRREMRELLTQGTLYVADFSENRWIPLDIERTPKLREAFQSQAEVLADCRKAASVVKATPVDRPEDCEVHPRDGSVYIALSNNTKHGNFWGQIVRLVEDGEEPDAESFQYEIFLAGGPQSGLASPDNLVFDPQGNLWVACDVSSYRLGKGSYGAFRNNGLYFVGTSGPSAGDAYQFASGPIECELAGPWFTEDGSTLFLSIQHPGEESRPGQAPTSLWPRDRKEPIPRPAVVAISGFRWNG